MNLDIDLSDLSIITNDVYYQHYTTKTRFLILKGGAGSGKSVFLADKIIFRILTEKNHKILVMRKVGTTLRESVFALFKNRFNVFGLTDFAKINKSDMKISLPAFNSEIIFIGADDIEKLKSITGITSVWLEEATEFSEKDLNQINLRLRGLTQFYKQIALSFNPIDPEHWIKKRFFDQKQENTTLIETNYKHNRFLDEEYKEELERLKNIDYYYYQVYVLNQWGVLQGKIFKNYEVKDFSEIEPTFDWFYQGVDWGFSIDPFAFIKLYVDIKHKIIYVCEELYLYGYSNDQSAEEVKKIADNSNICADSAEPKSIRDFCAFGLSTIAAKKGAGSIDYGIKKIQGCKVIISPKCINAKKEFDNYKYSQDKNDNITRKPVDKDNHIIDSMRYALEDVVFSGGELSGLV
ncbi:MAG: PBSX family phage terminase large subunit [bacterium]|nr:PBSX family phage terminase large subunit [bacterium]